jgi:hypothetical protein
MISRPRFRGAGPGSRAVHSAPVGWPAADPARPGEDGRRRARPHRAAVPRRPATPQPCLRRIAPRADRGAGISQQQPASLLLIAEDLGHPIRPAGGQSGGQPRLEELHRAARLHPRRPVSQRDPQHRRPRPLMRDLERTHRLGVRTDPLLHSGEIHTPLCRHRQQQPNKLTRAAALHKGRPYLPALLAGRATSRTARGTRDSGAVCARRDYAAATLRAIAARSDPGTFGRCPGCWFVDPRPMWPVGS